MYLAGIPAGILVDSRGPRLSVLLGAISLFIGYYPIHLAYEKGEGSIGVPALCFFAFITGVGMDISSQKPGRVLTEYRKLLLFQCRLESW